ncbi:helix-turn-helix transcriptional regulator [Mesorhizobium sp. ZMM04-5]|uniref:Helix-turn-helix transcriptional regulator n=1 Tax=Mesorhizobium marinum TaxID=3228790 RepID=A0ABV3QWF3_9HYPH
MNAKAEEPLVPLDSGHSKLPIEGDEQGYSASPYLTVPQAAAYLRVSKNYLDKLRVSGTGPSFVRLGRRKVLYRKADLDQWINERIFGSTSQYGH